MVQRNKITQPPTSSQHCWTRQQWHSVRPSVLAFIMAGVALLVVSACTNQSNSLDELGYRDTMKRFIGIYHFLHYLQDLPFPVQRAPFVYGKFDVNGDGQDLYSWRARISNYGCRWEWTWDESKPWDSPDNRGLMQRSPLFAADHTPAQTRESLASSQSFPDTVIVAIVGPGTAFGEGKTSTPLKGLPPSAVLLVESRASGIPWPAPGDFDIRTMPRTINAKDGRGISGQNAGGFVVLFADGQVWFISDRVPFETLEKFFTISGADKFDREVLLGPLTLDRIKFEH
jgi:hypothetical protein